MSDGVLQMDGDGLVLQADVVFPSPYTAAAVFLGRTSNGWVDWIDEKGCTFYGNRKTDIDQGGQDG